MVDRTLTDIAAVKAILEEESSDYDAVIGDWIKAASELLYKAAKGREFIAAAEQPETRSFDFGGSYNPLTMEFSLRADLADTPTAVTVKNYAGDVLGDIDPATLVLLPRNRQPWQPIRRFRFAWTSPRWLDFPLNLLEVTGTWGFPAVPDDISDACAKQVALWVGKNLQQFSETFAVDQGHIVRPKSLDAAIRDVAESYALDLL